MDPERPIEKVLRAHAKKRRDEAGAPFELHPADRKALQAEVEQKFAKQKRSGTFLQTLRLAWPRLIWGTAIFAVLAIIAFMLVPTSNISVKSADDSFMAQNTPMPAEPPLQRLAPAAVPSGAEQLRSHSSAAPSQLADLAYKKLPEKEVVLETRTSSSLSPGAPVPMSVPGTVADLKSAEPAPAAAPSASEKQLSEPGQGLVLARNYGILTAPSATPVPAETRLTSAPGASTEFSNGSLAAARLALADKPSVSANTAPMPQAAEALAKNDSSNKDTQTTISQRFTQIQPATKSKMVKTESVSSSDQVLAAFQVQQMGDELRIIDNDGSIYTGRLVASDAMRSRYTESKDAAASAVKVQSNERSFQASAGLASALQNYSFRVTGTNRSMNQNIVFSGNFAPATNAVSLGATTNSVNTGIAGALNYGTAQNSNQMLNSRISGRAQIGKGKEIQIDAISAP